MSAVSIVKCSKIDNVSALKKSLIKSTKLVGGLESHLGRRDRVLLKPNVLFSSSYESGAITNPYLVEALIDILRDFGIRDITIGEGSIVGKSTVDSFKDCGYKDLAGKKDVKLVDFKKDEFIPVGNSSAKIFKIIHIPKTVLYSDFIINIPVMKTHDSFPATLGLKNMKGIIREKDKKKFHLLDLAQCVVDLNLIALPHLTIIDGTVGMEGLGPLYGDPVNLGLMVSSFDTVAADAVGAKIMGIKPEAIKYLKLAVEHGLGSIKEIEVVGEKIRDVKRKFKIITIKSEDYQKFGAEIRESGTCSGCMHTLETYLSKLNSKNKMEEVKDCIFLLGQKTKLKQGKGKKVIKFGSCTKNLGVENSIYIPGCPPHMDVIRGKIKEKDKI